MNAPAPPQLRDIALPDAVHWWPPAPGWWLLAVLMLLLTVLIIHFGRKHYCRRKPYRAARRTFVAIQISFQQHQDRTQLLRELSTLLRQAALTYFGRSQIAGLTGEPWLRFLDAHLPGERFHQGVGQIFAMAPYQAHAEYDSDAILLLIKDWLTCARKDMT